MVTNNSINNETTNNYTVTDGNLLMDNTNTGGTTGIIEFGGSPFISNYGIGNAFIGQSAGNTTMTGNQNVALGFQSLNQNTSGQSNSSLGWGAAYANTSGEFNTAIGNQALFNNTIESNNTAVGCVSMFSSTGSYETTAVGFGSLANSLAGMTNTAVGYEAGLAYTGSESRNITIGSPGVVGEMDTTHLGSTQTTCYIAGINGATPVSANSPEVVLCDSNGNLTTISSGTSGQVLTSSGTGTPSFTSLTPGSITILGDTGGISGSTLTIYADLAANNSGASVSFANSGSTSTFNLSDPSGNTYLGNVCGKLGNTGSNNTGVGYTALYSLNSGSGNVAVGAAAGTNYSGGESNNICLGNSIIGTSGESNAIHIGDNGSFTSCAVGGIYGVTTSANSPSLVVCDSNNIMTTTPSSGTVGFVLTDNGYTAAPTFQAAPTAPITITGDFGSITGSNLTIYANQASLNSGSSVNFFNSGTTSMFSVTDVNYNTMMGLLAGTGSLSGTANTALGAYAGSSYTSSETNNICLGYQVLGNTGESNTIHIGDNGAFTSCFIGGITGGITLLSGQMVVCDSNNTVSVIDSGSANQVLTSNGPSSTPSFKNPAASSITVHGDSGSISGPSLTIFADQTALNCGSSVSFVNSGVTSTLNVTDPSLFNTIIGLDAGIAGISGNINTGVGYRNLSALTSGTQNTSVGSFSLNANTSGSRNTSVGAQGLVGNTLGSDNVAIGFSTSMGAGTISQTVAVGSFCMTSSTGAANTGMGYGALGTNTTGDDNTALGWQSQVSLTSGSNNTSCGYFSLGLLLTGSDNTVLGNNAGNGYTSSETNNICIGNGALGTAGESNVIHLGNTSTITSCYVAGISGVSVTGAPVIVSSSGQLGVTVSSQRYKENIQPMDVDDFDVLSLQPVTFNYKSDVTKTSCMGLIAEDVETKIPELVIHKDGQVETVKYHELPILLLAQIKKQQSDIDYLMKRIFELEEKVK
jgi:trimeric autotransporter adhesin